MWLAVDSGNTRVKWARMAGDKLLSHQAVEKTRFALPRREGFDAIWVSHTGSRADLRRVKSALAGRGPVHFAVSQRRLAGLSNTYRDPAALGADRWLCLLAAWQRRAVRRRGAVVVSAGTAITIDVLQASGRFVGGLILPGLALMPLALAQHTPLPRAKATAAKAKAATAVATASLPRETAAAMAAGAVFAAAGAVQAVRRRHAPGAPLFLTGGDAEALQPHLPQARLLPQLLFAGMASLRREARHG